MKKHNIALLIMMTISFSFSFCSQTAAPQKTNGAFWTGEYPNLFVELLDKQPQEVQAKIDQTWEQLFFGDDKSERVYYEIGDDMGYIVDINNDDVRSEGMSYGMMIAVQMDQKEVFDRLWKWAKTYMQHKDGQRKDFFAWSMTKDGVVQDPNSASDGEEWIVTSLYFAAARWGNGEGIYNYTKEAQTILDAMLSKTESSDSTLIVTNMFNKSNKQVVFVPIGNADDFTDPSYHLPHFYELWGRWADKNRDFWLQAVDSSRAFLKTTTHPKTGLAPDYANFDGTPTTPPWGGGHDAFRFDAWRVAMNVAMDYVWFQKDEWAVMQSNRWLNFFTSEGLDNYVNQYSIDGKRLSNGNSTGLVAMNAVATLASTNENRDAFLQALWQLPIPTGRYRYYDGLLQMLAILQVSGEFQIYVPAH